MNGKETLDPGYDQGGNRFSIFKNTIVTKEPHEPEDNDRGVTK